MESPIYISQDYSVLRHSMAYFSSRFYLTNPDYNYAAMGYPSYEPYSVHNKWYQSSQVLGGFPMPTDYEAPFPSVFMENQAQQSNLDFPRFNGQYRRTWLWRCQRYFMVNPMNEQEKVFMASLHLDGNVEDWYNDCIDDLEHLGWEVFSSMVIGKFATEEWEIKGKETVEIESHQLFDKRAESKSKTFIKAEEFKSTLEVNAGADIPSLPSVEGVDDEASINYAADEELLEKNVAIEGPQEVFDEINRLKLEFCVEENEDNWCSTGGYGLDCEEQVHRDNNDVISFSRKPKQKRKWNEETMLVDWKQHLDWDIEIMKAQSNVGIIRSALNGMPLSRHFMHLPETLLEALKFDISSGSIKDESNILQRIQNENKNSKKSLKDVAIENEFEQKLIAKVRMSVLEHVKGCLMVNTFISEASQRVSALCVWLLNYDENVGKQVVVQDDEIDNANLGACDLTSLRYYYALVECDSITTTEYRYWFKFERSSNQLWICSNPSTVTGPSDRQVSKSFAVMNVALVVSSGEGSLTMKALSSNSEGEKDAQSILNNLPRKELQILCSLFAKKGMSDNVYTEIAEVLRKSVAVYPTRGHMFINELASSVQGLAKSAIEELGKFGDILFWNTSKDSFKDQEDGYSPNVATPKLSSAVKRLHVIILHWLANSKSRNHQGQLLICGSDDTEYEEALNHVSINVAFIGLRRNNILHSSTNGGRFLPLGVNDCGFSVAKLSKSNLNESSSFFMGFPVCGSSYFLVQLDEEFKPCPKLVEVQICWEIEAYCDTIKVTGVKVLAAKSNSKHIALDLGGKAPFIICEGADVDQVVAHCQESDILLTAVDNIDISLPRPRPPPEPPPYQVSNRHSRSSSRHFCIQVLRTRLF